MAKISSSSQANKNYPTKLSQKDCLCGLGLRKENDKAIQIEFMGQESQCPKTNWQPNCLKLTVPKCCPPSCNKIQVPNALNIMSKMLAVDDDRIAHLQEFLQVGIISLLHGKWALTFKNLLGFI